jgi:hypothetical protein
MSAETINAAGTWEMKNRLCAAMEEVADCYRDWLHGIAGHSELREDLDRLETVLWTIRKDPKFQHEQSK